MTDTIQFNCPFCATLLRLPATAASMRGPCPSCRKEITAPGPDQESGKDQASPTDPQEPPIRLEPAAKVAPVPPIPQQAVGKSVETANLPTSDSTAPTEKFTTREAPRWIILVLCCLFTGVVGIGIGFTFGVYTNQLFNPSAAGGKLVVIPSEPKEPDTTSEPITVEPVEGALPPESSGQKATAPDAGVKADETAASPQKASAAAEASLRAFLDAPDWAARSAHVLNAENVRSAMEAYSHKVSDGPTTFRSISVKQSQIDEATGNTLFIFTVTTEEFPAGIPVAVKETSSGWLVDWLTFVEFRDGLFQSFVDGPANEPRFFHLIVTPPADPSTGSTSSNFTCYDLMSPLAGKSHPAFVKSDSHAATRLMDSVSDGRICTPVLEVVKRDTSDKRSFIEILSIKADDWFPRED